MTSIWLTATSCVEHHELHTTTAVVHHHTTKLCSIALEFCTIYNLHHSAHDPADRKSCVQWKTKRKKKGSPRSWGVLTQMNVQILHSCHPLSPGSFQCAHRYKRGVKALETHNTSLSVCSYMTVSISPCCSHFVRRWSPTVMSFRDSFEKCCRANLTCGRYCHSGWLHTDLWNYRSVLRSMGTESTQLGKHTTTENG